MKHILKFAFCLFLVLSLHSCKNRDELAPQIVLTGESEISIALYSTFQELGFTAEDDVDGDLTAQVVVDDSALDTDNLGTYKVYYSVTDEAGNRTDVSRTVNVVMMRENYVGGFEVGDNCAQFFFNSVQSVSAGTGGFDLIFAPIYDIGLELTGTFFGQDITISPQTLGTNELSGTGTITDDASTIILNLTVDPFVGGQTNCVLTYTRD